MSDWYCGSVQYTAVAQFATSHAYSIGDIVRQLATPAQGNERCFRCTTAGTSGGTEASWNLSKGATTTQGTAVFTEVTGNSTYNWNAPHKYLGEAAQWATGAGDRIFVAHDHAETYTGGNLTISQSNSGLTTFLGIYCVNAAGSVPPVSADLRTTATVTTTAGEIQIWNGVSGCAYFYGITFKSGTSFRVGVTGGNFTVLVFENCGFTFNSATVNGWLIIGSTSQNRPSSVTFLNTPVVFGHASQAIYPSGEFIWRNTASAIGAGTVPTGMIIGSAGTATVGGSAITLDGLDLSALTTQVFNFPNLGDGLIRAQAINCKLNASVTPSNNPGNFGQIADFTGCDSAANCARNARYTLDGTMLTEETIVRSSGASDGVTPVSWKCTTTGNPNKQHQFELPPIAIWNSATGSSKTLTVEIVNDGTTLTNADVWVEVEYLGSSTAPLASLATNKPADHLTSGSNLASSSASWTTTGLTTPIAQSMSVSFTPQMAGLIRATVHIAKTSKTIYVDPKVTIA